MRVIFIVLFVFLNHYGFSQNISSTPNFTIEGKNPVQRFSKHIPEVQGNAGAYGIGLITGTFLKISKNEVTSSTVEIQIRQGHFPNTSYKDQLLTMTVEDQNLINQLSQLDSQQVYVFQYRDYRLANELIGILPLNTNTDMNSQAVIKASSIEKEGFFLFSNQQNIGRIITVKRWGFFDTECSFVLNTIVSDETPIYFEQNKELFWPNIYNVYSEEGCQFAEEALKSGKDVMVQYSEDFIEIWDIYDKIAEEITLVN